MDVLATAARTASVFAVHRAWAACVSTMRPWLPRPWVVSGKQRSTPEGIRLQSIMRLILQRGVVAMPISLKLCGSCRGSAGLPCLACGSWYHYRRLSMNRRCRHCRRCMMYLTRCCCRCSMLECMRYVESGRSGLGLALVLYVAGERCSFWLRRICMVHGWLLLRGDRHGGYWIQEDRERWDL
jgi:hypothetical protein